MPDLQRFVLAQEPVYTQALSELRAGQKRTHWMWFVFPQLAGLGSSPTAVHYALQDVAEARDYLAHPILGPRLQECVSTVLGVRHRAAHDIFGSPDDLKFRSCVTLFAMVAPAGSVFHQALDTFFGGEPDPVTRRLLKAH